MTYDEICDAVQRLKRKYDETDPRRLCAAMGINLLYFSFGTADDAIKGFYTECKRIKTIVINSDLPVIVQRIILAHELGHATLHRTGATAAFHEVTLFDQSSTNEKDANFFAAEMLLEDEDVLDALNQDVTFFGAAAMLYVPTELLDFKFRLLKWKGYKLRESPITVDSTFLKNMEVPEDGEYY